MKSFKVKRKILDLHPPLKGNPGVYCYDGDAALKLEGRHWKFIILE